jgi:ubiquinol-cytochrome c reductase cytochrome b subunit
MAVALPIKRPPPETGEAPPTAQTAVESTGGLWGWLDDRMGLSALRYPVPMHANTFWYTLGGITFIGIVVLALTGIWLAQYYNPDPAAARESVAYIQNLAPFGDVIRGVHVWIAYLVVITAFLHLMRVFVTGSFKAPRELNWIVGLGLLAALMFGEVFSGTVLRWDQEAYEALEHNMAAAALLGAVGGFFSRGFTSSVAILPRLYSAHVSIVPLTIVLLLIAHIFLIKHHGISPTPAQAERGQAPGGRLPKSLVQGHYPTHLRLMIGYGMALVALAGAIGLIWPQPIGPAPDPSLEITKPPFLFYWLYAFEDWFGIPGILYAGIAFFGLLIAVPIADFGPARALRRRPIIAVLAAVFLLAIVALSIYVGLQPPAKHLGM